MNTAICLSDCVSYEYSHLLVRLCVIWIQPTACHIVCHMNTAIRLSDCFSYEYSQLSWPSTCVREKWQVVQEWIEKQVIIHDFELTEISDVVDICARTYWLSQSCDSRHVCRRNTAVAVTHSDPVGMLVCLTSLRSYTLCVRTEGVSSARKWTVMIRCPGSRLSSGAADLHLEKTVLRATIRVDDSSPRWHKSTLRTSGTLLGPTDVQFFDLSYNAMQHVMPDVLQYSETYRLDALCING